MSTTGNMISDSLKLGMGYADRLLTDIQPDQFARFASLGGTVVESNHACFIFGHLALYPSKVISHLGGQADEPSGFNVFSKDAKCLDDPDGSIYPSMDVVVSAFKEGYGDVITTLGTASDDAMAQPNPSGGRMTELFPTLGSMLAFYAGGHMMMHLGQLSAWRRMVGLGSA